MACRLVRTVLNKKEVLKYLISTRPIGFSTSQKTMAVCDTTTCRPIYSVVKVWLVLHFQNCRSGFRFVRVSEIFIRCPRHSISYCCRHHRFPSHSPNLAKTRITVLAFPLKSYLQVDRSQRHQSRQALAHLQILSISASLVWLSLVVLCFPILLLLFGTTLQAGLGSESHHGQSAVIKAGMAQMLTQIAGHAVVSASSYW